MVEVSKIASSDQSLKVFLTRIGLGFWDFFACSAGDISHVDDKNKEASPG